MCVINNYVGNLVAEGLHSQLQGIL